MAADFKPPVDWLGGREPLNLFGRGVAAAPLTWLAVPALFLAFALVVALRRRCRDLFRYVVLVVALFVAGILSMSRITGVAWSYLFQWRPVLTVGVVVAVAVAASLLLAPRLRHWGVARTRVAILGASLVVVVPLSGGLAIDVARHPAPVKAFEGATASLTKSLERRGAPRHPVLTRFDTDSPAQLQRGVFDALDRKGFALRVDRRLAYQYGEQYAADARDVGEVWWFADSGLALLKLGELPGARVIAMHSPLSRHEEAEARALERKVYKELEVAARLDLAKHLNEPLVAFVVDGVPGIDKQAAGRLGELNAAAARGSCRCGVVSVPPQEAPATFRQLMASLRRSQ
jgi:hypothetical protein